MSPEEGSTSKNVDSSRSALAGSAYLRLLGLVYFFAFFSLWQQAPGLWGENGLSPIFETYSLLTSKFGSAGLLISPSILWLAPNSVNALLLGGWISGLLLALGILPQLSAFCCWLFYLSIVNADQTFLSFQWDNLLLEAGFISIFLAPLKWHSWKTISGRDSDLALWLLKLLLCRLYISSALVKILSEDPTWRDFSALEYHFLSQPLPNIAAYYVHRLPAVILHFLAAAMFFVELIVPIGFFLKKSWRQIAGLIALTFQILIALTGNYGFFNLLSGALCLSVFPNLNPWKTDDKGATRRGVLRMAIAPAILIVSGIQMLSLVLSPQIVPKPVRDVSLFAEPLHLVNRYGLFAVMTTRRAEIVIEGSADGEHWMEYEFFWKPGDLKTPPLQVAPFQPRLDWQMWFAALSSSKDNPWFARLMSGLLNDVPEITSLLKTNPFSAAKPKFVRALIYEYMYTAMSEKDTSGNWWERALLGYYAAPITTELPITTDLQASPTLNETPTAIR